MGKRKIIIPESVIHSISAIAWYIESNGFIAGAENFSQEAYDFIGNLANDMVVHSLCREPGRNLQGLKCKTFRRKYTVVFYEDKNEIIISEFIPSKLIRW